MQLSVSSNKYFLVTTSSEAITLDVPLNFDLLKLVGKRIFAVGEYSKSSRVLKIIDVKDFEVLPLTPVPIPTIEATTSPSATPSISDILIQE